MLKRELQRIITDSGTASVFSGELWTSVSLTIAVADRNLNPTGRQQTPHTRYNISPDSSLDCGPGATIVLIFTEDSDFSPDVLATIQL